VGSTKSIASTNCGNQTHDNEANAARLAHCWNNHDKLVTALKNLLEAAIHCDPHFEHRWEAPSKAARQTLAESTLK
jgi:hypothetical protein